MSQSPKSNSQGNTKGRKHGVLPFLCYFAGFLFLVCVIILAAPLTVPRIMGYEVYEVVSGSMEPEIPVDSVCYVKPVAPEQLAEGEVIAFLKSESDVVVHRVVYNKTSLGELVTKGDNNNVEDPDPVPYAAVIGRVEMHLPLVGRFMALYASTVGKVYLLLAAACGVMFIMLGGRLAEC